MEEKRQTDLTLLFSQNQEVRRLEELELVGKSRKWGLSVPSLTLFWSHLKLRMSTQFLSIKKKEERNNRK